MWQTDFHYSRVIKVFKEECYGILSASLIRIMMQNYNILYILFFEIVGCNINQQLLCGALLWKIKLHEGLTCGKLVSKLDDVYTLVSYRKFEKNKTF